MREKIKKRLEARFGAIEESKIKKRQQIERRNIWQLKYREDLKSGARTATKRRGRPRGRQALERLAAAKWLQTGVK